MRETPRAFERRAGTKVPETDVSAGGVFLGSAARPVRLGEVCPTLYRDVGPQALASFLRGDLTRLEGPSAVCVFMRDATLPVFSGCAREFGLLAVLEPLALGPWWSGQAGIWLVERGRFPARGGLGFVPGDEPLPALDARLGDVANVKGLRAVLGGRRYDVRVARARAAVGRYLEEWGEAERYARPIRAALDDPRVDVSAVAAGVLEDAGLTSKDLRAPWYHLAPERRREVLKTLPAVFRGLAKIGKAVGRT